MEIEIYTNLKDIYLLLNFNIDKFYFIYCMGNDTTFQYNTIGLGISENNKSNILLLKKSGYIYDETGNNYFGVKVLNKDLILGWVGCNFKVIENKKFSENNNKQIYGL